MNEYIAYCGLDCETCEARIATANDDNELREKVAKLNPFNAMLLLLFLIVK